MPETRNTRLEGDWEDEAIGKGPYGKNVTFEEEEEEEDRDLDFLDVGDDLQGFNPEDVRLR